MKLMSLFRRLNWTNTLFLLITPIVGIGGAIYLTAHHEIYWQTLLLTVIFTFLGGMSITGGYHRLFSHGAYKSAWIVRLLYVIFGSASFEGSVLEWCTDHRNHHRYTDTDKDPYDSKKGFWYSHIGWLFLLDGRKRDYSNVEDLAKDPMLQFQHKHFVAIAILAGMLLPALIASLWGDFIGGLLLAGVLRIVLNQHFTFCINSFCHMIGKQTYSDRISARDNWFTALLTYGEGYHNFHHQFPLDYRNAIKFYQYDPTKWLIIALTKLGLASDLRTVKQSLIVQYRLRMDEQAVLAKAERNAALKEHFDHVIQPLREAILQLLPTVDELEKACADMKHNGGVKLVELKERLKVTQAELNHRLKNWNHAVNQTHLLAAA